MLLINNNIKYQRMNINKKDHIFFRKGKEYYRYYYYDDKKWYDYFTAVIKVSDNTPIHCESIHVTDQISALRYLRKNAYAIKYIHDQTPEICMFAVQRNGYAINFIRHQTPEICLAAVQQNGYAIKYVKELTPELCIAAVQKEGNALKYISRYFLNLSKDNISDNNLDKLFEIYMAAIKSNIKALRYIKQSNRMFKRYQCYSAKLCDIFMTAVQLNALSLKYIKYQTPEICMAAVRTIPLMLKYVINKTPEICMTAVQINGLALQYVDDQTPEICMAAVSQNGYALGYIKDVLIFTEDYYINLCIIAFHIAPFSSDGTNNIIDFDERFASLSSARIFRWNRFVLSPWAYNKIKYYKAALCKPARNM